MSQLGGGFMNSPSGSANGSPGGQFRRGAALHSLRPVTIRQLINATQAHSEADWMIDDADIGQVTLVASVISIQSQATSCVYWLDDGTGRMEARYWFDSTDGEEYDSGIAEQTFIRVMGSLKSFGNKRLINAQRIRQVEDPHEVFFHILEVFTVATVFQRGPPGSGGKGRKAIANGDTDASAYSAQPQGAAPSRQFAELPPLQRRIAEFMLNQNSSDEGIPVGAIARAMQVDAGALSHALDLLMDEGVIFTTTDDSHFSLSI